MMTIKSSLVAAEKNETKYDVEVESERELITEHNDLSAPMYETTGQDDGLKIKLERLPIDIDDFRPDNCIGEDNPTQAEPKKQDPEKREPDKQEPDKRFCSLCNRNFNNFSEDRYNRHMRMHRGENPFQCSMCEYSTYNNKRMEEHTNMHKGIRPYKCSICPYASNSKKYIKKHELTHKRPNTLHCGECDYAGRSKILLKQHREQVHSNKKAKKRCNSKKEVKQEPKTVSNETNSFKCQLCEWTGSSKHRILLHLIHHPNQEVDESKLDISVLRKAGIMT